MQRTSIKDAVEMLFSHIKFFATKHKLKTGKHLALFYKTLSEGGRQVILSSAEHLSYVGIKYVLHQPTYYLPRSAKFALRLLPSC